MRKNYFLRAAAVLLVCGMFGLCTVPGTLSKYNYTVNTSSTSVRAGVFSVAVKRGNSWVDIASGDLTGSGEDLTIDLFEALKDTNATPETDVMAAPGLSGSDSTVIIAPGTGGEFKITVKNFSEVDVNIEVESGTPVITGNLNLPIEWQQSGGSYGAAFPGVTGGNATLPAGPKATGSVSPLNGEATYTFTWRWVYESGAVLNWYKASDPGDTGLGVPGTVTYKIPLTIRAVQID